MQTALGSAPVEVVKQLLAGAGELPLLPNAAVRILEELRSPQVSAKPMADLVSQDPVLAAAVLRLANSALYGGRTEINDLPFAMVRIGLHQVRNLVLALVLRSRMADPEVYGALGEQLMDHALAVAFGARMLATPAGADGERAFLCGLLHDFGRLALIKALREAAGIKHGSPPPSHLQLVDEHHAEAGALLATAWRLPEVVAHVARLHHKPEQAIEHRTMVAVVSCADALAHRLGLGEVEEAGVALEQHPAVKLLGLRLATLEEIQAQLPVVFATAWSVMCGS